MCGHVYHYRCILQSIQYKAQCPNCNAGLEEEALHRVAPSYMANVSSGGGGGGEGEITENVQELKSRLSTSLSQTERITTECKALREKAGRAETAYNVLAKQHSEVLAAQKSTERLKAAHWDDMRILQKECTRLRGALEASGFREEAETSESAEVSESILCAAPEAKNQYIKDLHRLLHKEKARTAEGGKVELKLRAANQDLASKVTRYREKLKRKRDGEGGGGAGGGSAVANISQPLERLSNRVETHKLRRTGGMKHAEDPPSDVIAISMQPTQMVKRATMLARANTS